jgi:hypothetical protein
MEIELTEKKPCSMRRVAILITLIMVLCSSGALGQVSINRAEPKRDISIDYAYFRRMSVWDMETVHLFIRNEESSRTRINVIYVDGVAFPVRDLQKETSAQRKAISGKSSRQDTSLNERSVWHQVLPNPIGLGEVANVMVKLSKLIHQPIDR